MKDLIIIAKLVSTNQTPVRSVETVDNQLENGASEKQRKKRQGGRAGDGGGRQSRGLSQQFRDWHFGEILLQVIRAKCEHKRARMKRGYFA